MLLTLSKVKSTNVAKYMRKQRKLVEAVAYLRTSSSTNSGPDKDSDKRQRAAITAFAKAHGYTVVDEFYDAAVSGRRFHCRAAGFQGNARPDCRQRCPLHHRREPGPLRP